ncbi:MAG TPA: substrate-binding domain-containing protein [Humisphaera sp.]
MLLDTASSGGGRIVTGIADYARQHGRWLFHIEHRGPQEHPDVPAGWEGDGVIARVTSPAFAEQLRSHRLAVVNVSRARVAGTESAQHVIPDDAAAGVLAAETLLATGARHFAYAGPGPREHYEDRLGAAFADRLAREGHAVTAVSPGRAPPGEPASHANLARTAEWLAGLPSPVAVFAWDAAAGVRILEACAWAGLRVPEEVRVLAGCADELMAHLSQPRLAMIDINPWQLGYRAAAELDRLMKGGPVGPPVLVGPAGVVAGDSIPTAGGEDPVLRRALDQMRRRLSEPLPVTELAKAAGVSRRTLELRFRAAIGRSPAYELRRMRVDRACQMLVETQLPVQAIAAACGFTAVELLQRAMQKQLGMTPTRYRQKHRATPV